MKRCAARALLVALGLLLGLVLLEAGLRVAGAFAGGLRAGAPSAKRAATTLLCVGDSHTYGLHVLPSHSYPARLQARLDPSAVSIGVLNYGVPGRNSAALLRALPAYLEETRPDLVLACVGFNDSWNFDGAAEDDAGGSWSSNLRVVRMVRLLLLRGRGREPAGARPEVFERDGRLFVREGGVERPAAIGGGAFGVREGPELTVRLERNLARIDDLVRARGARLVLITYATENQPIFVELNDTLRRIATERGLPLVDVATPMRERIAALGYQALFLDDDHPSALGYQEVARIVATRLEELGLVAPVPDAAQPEARVDAPTLELESAGAGIARLELRGPPGLDFQVVLSPRAEPAIELDGVLLPLGPDELLTRSLESLNLRGRLDGSGHATIDVPATLLSGRSGQPLRALAAVFTAGRGRPVASNVVTFSP